MACVRLTNVICYFQSSTVNLSTFPVRSIALGEDALSYLDVKVINNSSSSSNCCCYCCYCSIVTMTTEFTRRLQVTRQRYVNMFEINNYQLMGVARQRQMTRERSACRHSRILVLIRHNSLTQILSPWSRVHVYM